jgi:hypothetical protein
VVYGYRFNFYLPCTHSSAGVEAIEKPWKLWASWQHKFGDIVKLDLISPKFVVLYTTKHIEEVGYLHVKLSICTSDLTSKFLTHTLDASHPIHPQHSG